jgi:hypothetical protein
VEYLLKARTVEAEKQPLLTNGSKTTFVVRQQIINKQVYTALLANTFTNERVPTTTNQQAAAEELLEVVFSVFPVAVVAMQRR